MKILFDHHSPFLLAHGGFQIQIEQTFRALREIGVDVDWLRWWDDSPRPDLIHFFGKVHAGYLHQARAKGIKTVINELHTGLGSRAPWKHKLQGAIIGAARKIAPYMATRMSWDTYDYPDAIMALTPYEARLMCEIFHAPPHRMHVVPNGVDDVFIEKHETKREDWLICTAVIHPRKRVLELAESAGLAGVKIRFFGKPYSETEDYYTKFLATVAKYPNLLEFNGMIGDRAELANSYRRARGFVLPSTMESLSLSALEAAATGCPLLLSDLPWARETFDNKVSYLPNTGDALQLAEPLLSFYQNSTPGNSIQVLSWREVADQLQSLYKTLF